MTTQQWNISQSVSVLFISLLIELYIIIRRIQYLRFQTVFWWTGQRTEKSPLKPRDRANRHPLKPLASTLSTKCPLGVCVLFVLTWRKSNTFQTTGFSNVTSSPVRMHGFTGSEWRTGGCVFTDKKQTKKTTLMFIGQRASPLSCLDARLVPSPQSVYQQRTWRTSQPWTY